MGDIDHDQIPFDESQRCITATPFTLLSRDRSKLPLESTTAGMTKGLRANGKAMQPRRLGER
jgi:hypothetical protein